MAMERPRQDGRKVGEEEMDSGQSMLPKPVRTFSFLFFGAVLLIGLCGWFATGHP